MLIGSPPTTVLAENGENENRVADGLKPECGARHGMPQNTNRTAKQDNPFNRHFPLSMKSVTRFVT